MLVGRNPNKPWYQGEEIGNGTGQKNAFQFFQLAGLKLCWASVDIRGPRKEHLAPRDRSPGRGQSARMIQNPRGGGVSCVIEWRSPSTVVEIFTN